MAWHNGKKVEALWSSEHQSNVHGWIDGAWRKFEDGARRRLHQLRDPGGARQAGQPQRRRPRRERPGEGNVCLVSRRGKAGPAAFTQEDIDALAAGRRAGHRDPAAEGDPGPRPRHGAVAAPGADHPAPPLLKRGELASLRAGRPSPAVRKRLFKASDAGGGQTSGNSDAGSLIRRSSLPSVPVNVPDVPSLAGLGGP